MGPAIIDDEVFRKLELQYRRAVVKVFCSKRPGGDREPWTGFVVNANPCIIVTVSHPVSKFSNVVVNAPNIFYVNFFEDITNYPAVAQQCSSDRDLLVLHCDIAPKIPAFAFAPRTTKIQSCTTFFSIAHPDRRGWRIHRGTVCCDQFELGRNTLSYRENMTIFDHDAPLYPGASGAPIINLRGEVIGMQVTWEVKELSLLSCNLWQALTVQYMADSLEEMFPREVSDPYTSDPNVFLRTSISRNLRRRGFQSLGQGVQSTGAPQGSSSRKRPWKESMLQSITDANPKILHRHVGAADLLLDYVCKAKARSLKLSCNKQTGQPDELRSVEFLSHAAANNISQSYNATLVPNTDHAFPLNGSTFSTGERSQDVRDAEVVVDAKTGRREGSVFVRFGGENEKSRIMTEMNGQYCSRPMGICVATPKKPSMPQQQYSLQIGAAANCAFTQGSQSDDDTSNTTVFVGGLDFDVGDKEVRHTFSQFGEDVSVKIPIGKGCGFVQFVERTIPENSINQLSGTVVGKQTVCLSWGRNPGNKQKGSGFVRLGDENEESRAMTEMNGQYCSRPMGTGVATPKKPSTPQQKYSLQVAAAAAIGGFTQGSQFDDDTSNTTVSDEEIRHAFSQFGEVISVKIPIGKGCGFVQFAERSSAENSINQLNGTVVGKQTVSLSWGQNPGNKQFSNPVGAVGDKLMLFHVELEADKEKTATELLHNQLDAIVYKAMATC
ncbi:hypothetical protein OROMI_014863 [Orobanche minor]